MKNIKNKYIATVISNISILLLFLFFSAAILHAQEIPTVNIILKLKVSDGDLKNSRISITKNGSPYIVIDPHKEGNAVKLPLNFEYTFTYTKIGYNTKRVIMDTHIPEKREKGEFAKHIFEVELDKLPGKLEDNYVQLLGKISYNTSRADFYSDFDKENLPKNDKTQQNEKQPSTPKIQPTPPSIKQSNPVSLLVKQSEKKSESGSYKPVVKNKDVKIIQEDYRKFTIITITIDGKNIVFKKEEYDWGVFYYKDGKQITESTFTNETL